MASGLLRKGFSVVVVPSAGLQELPPDEHWPLILPSQVGQRKLNDLLFRAGFFRLDESGLSAASLPTQVLLPRNRLLFEGAPAQWLSEIEREFPHALKTFFNFFENAKKLTPQHIRRTASEVFELQRRDPHFRSWISTELHSAFRGLDSQISLEDVKSWLQLILKQENKAYRVDPKIKMPYSQFLLEHAKKWGLVVCQEPVEIKSVWTTFQISKTAKASHLVLNGMGGGRLLAKTLFPKLSDTHKFWMYVDSIDTDLSFIPEPLQEFVQMNFGESSSDISTHRCLHLSVDRVRCKAHISLGTWLSFDETKSWVNQIEQGRLALKRIAPFIPESSFRPIPPLLELTEARGECIRRGQAERLIPEPRKMAKITHLFNLMARKFVVRRKPFSVARRVYAVSPHYLGYRNRLSSFEESLVLLDYFEKKKKRQVMGS